MVGVLVTFLTISARRNIRRFVRGEVEQSVKISCKMHQIFLETFLEDLHVTFYKVGKNNQSLKITETRLEI